MAFTLAYGSNVRQSPYFDATVADGAASFSVYNHMLHPAHYGDPDGEYERLLNGVVMWDVAVERQVQLQGADAGRLARYLTPREIRDTEVGQGKYVPLCDHRGILINDPVLLKLADDRYWLSIADNDIGLWAQAIAAERRMDVDVSEPDVSPLAVQGPKAADVVADIFGDWVRDLPYFAFRETTLDGIPLVVARSGWSKQGGFELYLRDGSRGTELWERVKDAGGPHGIGPGAPNDVERTESGLISWRADADPDTNPFEMGLGRFVDLDREDEFVGKAALRQIHRDGVRRRRVGLILAGERIAQIRKPPAVLLDNATVGRVSEALYSPRLEQNIAIALLDAGISDSENGLSVPIEGAARRATIADLPFC